MIDPVPSLNIACLEYGEEKNKFLLIDEFYPEPQQLITEASTGEAFVQQASDFYPGIRKTVSGAYVNYISDILSSAIQEYYGIPSSLDFAVSLCAFSIATMPETSLRPIQCVPHIDTHDRYQFAAVHYLCDEHFGGTSLYRHRSTGYESISDERLKPYFAQLKQEVMQEAASPEYIKGDTFLFERVGEIELKFNRLAIYPSNLLHSGNIDPAKGLSSDPLKGRLTINTFINFKEERT